MTAARWIISGEATGERLKQALSFCVGTFIIRGMRIRRPDFFLARFGGVGFCSLVSRTIILLAAVCFPCCLNAASGNIHKVLQHYLDQEGRQSLSPSLYERDAYQDLLGKNPRQRSTLRFDVHWKAKSVDASKLKLRLELRMSKGASAQPYILEQAVRRSRWFSQWSALKLPETDYHRLGEVMAWRATLWEGDQLLAEQKSFLW